MNIKLPERKPIGAFVSYRWHGSVDVLQSYISFGEWNEEMDTDSFGVLDEQILLYADDEDQLKAMMIDDNKGEFLVIDYTLSFEKGV